MFVLLLLVSISIATVLGKSPRNSHLLHTTPFPTTHRQAAQLYTRARAHGTRLRARAGALSHPHESTCNPATTATPSFRVTPAQFGGDPTGLTDSTQALTSAIQSLLNHSSSLPHMASSIVNHGGAMLDLAGGVYLTSAPLVIPVFTGNLHIGGSGTLRASSTFPKDAYLIQVGSPSCQPKDSQKVCNEFITVSNVFLDAAHVGAGGIRVSMTMGTTITNSFAVGFRTAGILVDQGHETMVSECWFAEYYWSEHHSQSTCNKDVDGSGSTGIAINGEDNIVSDVIVFDFTCLGVWVNGAANLLTGVHSWNGAGQVAISVNGSYDVQDRIVDCYLDYGVLSIVNPQFVLVQGNFFYNTHMELLGAQPVTQMIMKENMFSLNQYGGNKSVVVADGARCSQVTVEDNINAYQGTQEKSMHVLSTRLKRRRKFVAIENTTGVFVFDFSNALIFGKIDYVQYSVVSHLHYGILTLSHYAVQLNATAVQVVITLPAGCSTATGTVYLEVAECSTSHTS